MSRQIATTTFAQQLKSAQSTSGLSNEELARAADVKLRVLQRYRAGDVEPSGATLARLCRVLERPVEWFYDDRAAA